MVTNKLKHSLTSLVLAGATLGSAYGGDDTLLIKHSGSAPLGVQASQVSAIHNNLGTESGVSGEDGFWSAQPFPDVYEQGIKVFTNPNNQIDNELSTDKRNSLSDTRFNFTYQVADPQNYGFSLPTNYTAARFDISTSDATRLYLAKVHIDGQWTTTGQPFDYVGKVTNGNWIFYPGLSNVPNLTNFGGGQLSCMFTNQGSLGTIADNQTKVFTLTNLIDGVNVEWSGNTNGLMQTNGGGVFTYVPNAGSGQYGGDTLIATVRKPSTDEALGNLFYTIEVTNAPALPQFKVRPGVTPKDLMFQNVNTNQPLPAGTYTLEGSSDLSDWQAITSRVEAGTNYSFTLSDRATNGSAKFYRGVKE